MCGPKVTVIGAGSYFFGKPVIHKMATSPIMAGGTLALVDTKPNVVRTMTDLAQRAFAHTGCDVKVIGSTDRRDVLGDSDFVVLTFAERNAHYRGVDTEVAARHGIRMCSSDTIGPGGIFRALRETPHALAMAQDTHALAPNAWLINFVNPATVLGMALRRYAPEVKSFALCDGQHEPYCTLNWCKTVGILPPEAKAIPPDVQSRLDLAIGGVNHCTFVLRFRYDGVDMMPVLRETVARRSELERQDPQAHSKSRFNANYSLQLLDLYGVYPTAVAHTKEYVPFYQGYGVAANDPEPLRLFDGEGRAREMVAAWATTEEYAGGRIPMAEFFQKVHDDHATDIIESMWGGLGKPFFINTANRGAIPNLPDDAFLELRCHVDMNGPQPLPVGPFPRGALALQHQVLDTHELTAEAAVTGDRAILRRAMLTDPLCNNIADADNCIADLLEAERDVLPEYWYKYSSLELL
jgi:alpha-galactosidase